MYILEYTYSIKKLVVYSFQYYTIEQRVLNKKI